MDAQRWAEIERIFTAAVDLPLSDRAAYLDQATDDESIRAELRAMLDISRDGRELKIEDKLLGDEAQNWSANQRVGATIGNYRLIDLLGRGGMGDVYLARRVDGDIDHEVAIKLLRTAMVSEETVARFKTERRILARLSHPDIVGFIDSGMTDEGQPYLVMPVVRGLPITAYCDAHHFTVRERLGLFQRVCEAVQFAHRNLVVHRDIKPSNAYVTEDGNVRLLDFGIAKIVDPDEMTEIAMTRTGSSVMTPEYAAPEQVRGEPVTTAVDVYGLGLLLYELLSGKNPQRTDSTSRAELERMVISGTPRPLAEAMTDPSAAARYRGSSTRELSRMLSGDVQTIVDMALRKEPERRYGTAGELAEDIDRLLHGLPVRARPDTAGYRVRKFIGRNRLAMTASAAAVVALLTVTTLAVTQRNRAEAARERSEHVTNVLVDFIGGANPVWHAGADTLRVRDFLFNHEDRVIAGLADDPLVQSQLAYVYANIYLHDRKWDEAQELMELSYDGKLASLGPDHIEVLNMFHTLAVMEFATGGPRGREMLHESMERVRRRNPPALHTSLTYCARAAESWEERFRLLEEATPLREEHCTSDHCIAFGFQVLGDSFYDFGDIALATKHYERAAEITNVDAAEAGRTRQILRRSLASVYISTGEVERGEAMAKRVIETEREHVGPRTREIALATSQLGTIAELRGEVDRAETLFLELLEIIRRLDGSAHQRTADALARLARHYLRRGDLEAANAHIEAAMLACPPDKLVSRRSIRLTRLRSWMHAGNSAVRDSIAGWMPDMHDEPANMNFKTDLTLLRARLELDDGDPGAARGLFAEAARFFESRGAHREAKLAGARAGIGLCALAAGDRTEAREVLAEAAERYVAFPLADPVFAARIREGAELVGLLVP